LNATSTTLQGTITINSGATLAQNSTGSVTDLHISGPVILAGGGTLSLSNTSVNRIYGSGSDSLTNNATIQGSGQLGINGGSTYAFALTNNGTIVANQSAALQIAPSSTVTNTGTLRAAAGSTLNVIGGYTQTAGDTNILGTLSVTGGPLVAGGGTLSGSGTSTISGGFSLTGSFTKLDSGTTTISGPQIFSSGTTLNVNGGMVKFNVTSGSVTVGTGVSANIAAGATLELAGSVSALASGSNRVNIVNSSAAPGILVSGTNQVVGGIDGLGNVQVNAGSDLTANHIVENALVIGGTSTSHGRVTIDASDASGNPLAKSGFVLAGSLQSDVPFATGTSSSWNALETSEMPAGSAGIFLASAYSAGSASAMPEPSSVVLCLLGLASIAVFSSRRAKNEP
ncbi:MAG TPA: PEP-CTERM sorting domain-containing protein, partial [Pirellulales bacterium]|nr:PEP-CTERM sorting domain-containing protein [Pirellulales bacterium]